MQKIKTGKKIESRIVEKTQKKMSSKEYARIWIGGGIQTEEKL